MSEAFETILKETAWAKRVARAMIGREADDLLADAWTAAIENPPEQDDKVRGWLRVVMRRKAAKSRRRAFLAKSAEIGAARPEAVDSRDADDRLIDLHERLAAAVRDLPDPMRRAIILAYFKDMSGVEAARECGISHDAFRSRLSRALELLKKKFEKDFDSPRAAWIGLLALSGARIDGIGAGLAGASIVTKKSTAAALFFVLMVTGGLGTWWLFHDDAKVDGSGIGGLSTNVEAAENVTARRSADGVTSTDAAAAVAEEKISAVVVDENGSAVAAADVLFFTGDRVLGIFATDTNGLVALDSAEESVDVVVRSPRHDLRRFKVARSVRPTTLALDVGEELSGRVVVLDGRIPRDFRLTLLTESEPALIQELPPLVGERILELWGDPKKRSIAVDDDGRFSWRIADERFDASLLIPDAFRIVGAADARFDDRVALRGVLRDLEILIMSRTVVGGMLVDAATGHPLVGRKVAIRVADGGERTEDFRTKEATDEEGRFRIISDRVGPFDLSVTVSGAASGFPPVFRGLNGPKIDLGVIRVEMSTPLTARVLVIDDKDRPIVGAVVRVSSWADPREFRTATDGTVTVPGLEDDSRWLRISAPGFREKSVRVESADKANVVAELETESYFDIKVVDDAGAPIPGAIVAIGEFDPDDPTPSLWRPSPFRDGFHKTYRSGDRAPSMNLNLQVGRGAEGVARTDADGYVGFADLIPNVVCEADVLDDLGHSIAEPVRFEPPPSGRTEIVIAAKRIATRTVSGLVKDDEGRPIPYGFLGIVNVARPHARVRVEADSEGKFRWAGRLERCIVVTDDLNLVQKNYGPFEIPESGATLELEVERVDSHNFRFKIVDHRDRLILPTVQAPGVVAPKIEFGETSYAMAHRDGHWSVNDWPRGRAFAVTVDERPIPLRIPEDDEIAVVRLPPTGTLKLAVIGADPSSSILRASVRTTETSEPYDRRSGTFARSPNGDLSVEFPYLPAGTYVLSVEIGNGRLQDFKFSELPTSGKRTFTIVADETTHVIWGEER